MNKEQIENMTDAEFLAWQREERERDAFDSLIERNIKIDMLAKMSKEAIGEAFLYYVEYMKDDDAARPTTEEAIDAHSLICDILFLDLFHC